MYSTARGPVLIHGVGRLRPFSATLVSTTLVVGRGSSTGLPRHSMLGLIEGCEAGTAGTMKKARA